MPELTVAAVALFVATGVAVRLALSASRRPAPGSRAFVWLMLGVAEWTFTSGAHQLAPSLEAKIALARVQYAGIVSVPPLLLIFAAGYAEAPWLRDRRRVVALWIVPAITFALALGAQQLIWTRVSLTARGGAVYEHGPWFYVAAAYSYALMAAGSYYILRAMRRAPAYRGQAAALLVAALVPWAANILYLGRLVPLAGLDPTPLAFTITGLLIAWALYRRSLFDLVPVARDQLLDSLADAVLVVDASSRVMDMNAAARRLAGDRPWLGVQLADVLPFLGDVAGAPLLPGNVVGDGRHYDVRVTPVQLRFPRASAFAVLLHDVTEQRRAAEEREQLVRRKSDFVATVSHELRTPLFSINGALQLLVGGPSRLDPQDRRLVQIALSSCDRLARITNEILDVSRMEARQALQPRREPVAVDRVIADALFDVGGVARAASVELETRIPPAMPQMLGDHDRLVQVVVNLLSNAVKFSPSGSTVTIAATADASFVSVSVLDRGRGIDAAHLDRLFDRYHRVRDDTLPPAQGSGLGLAIARDIAEQHGGRISVTSTPGAGALFTLSIPRAPEGTLPAAAGGAAEAVTATHVGPARVLVVDDDEDVRDVVAEALERARFTVVRAAGGQAALDALGDNGIDLVVLDLHMPGINGYDVLRELRAREHGSHTPVIVLSGNVDSSRPPSQIGADALMAKPTDLRRLVAQVNALLEARAT